MRLTVEKLSYRYSTGKTIFKDLSFQTQTPEILCILGPNGVGKSTLLQCIAGVFMAMSGNIQYGRQNIKAYSRKDLAKIVAYIPQSHSTAFPYKVLDVVLMGRTAHLDYLGVPGENDRALAYQKLDFLEITHLANRPFTQLSGGEQQLVMIAAALTQEPQLLLLDEPTSHLDFGNQHRFLSLLKELSKQGIGVVMTSHFPDHALAVADQVLAVKEGRVICSGIPEKTITEEVLTFLYDLPIQIFPAAGRFLCAGKI